MRKVMLWIVLLGIAILSVFVYVRYFFVLGEGVKTGEMNYLVKKGYIFKTYEGKLIQSGIRSMSSYDFEFSVEDEKVAEKIMLNSGMLFDLHYKEYKGALPWRGFSKYIVDSVVSIKDPGTGGLIR